MITFVYCLIGVILTVWSFLTVSERRPVYGVDLSIAIIFYGILWLLAFCFQLVYV